MPPGAQLQLSAELHHGTIGINGSKNQFPRMSVETSWFDVPLIIDGSVASTHFECKHPNSFFKCVDLFAEILPAVISSAVAAPIEVVRVYGEAGGVEFQAEFKGSISSLVKTADLSVMVAKKMELIDGIAQEDADRLFSAHRYLLQARRLKYVSTYATQFISERLLNMYKMTEVLFGRSVDNVRAALKHMRVRTNVAEMVASLCYIRDAVDVGHPAIQSLEPEEYETIRNFAIAIEEVMSWVLEYVTAELKAERFQFGGNWGDGSKKKDKGGRSEKKRTGGKEDRSKVVSMAAAHLKSVQYLRPETFVEPLPDTSE
jgi:hypothetical protein